MDRCDIAIVGAGPAGAMCAWRLGADRRRHVVLLDAETAARHRPACQRFALVARANGVVHGDGVEMHPIASCRLWRRGLPTVA